VPGSIARVSKGLHDECLLHLDEHGSLRSIRLHLRCARVAQRAWSQRASPVRELRSNRTNALVSLPQRKHRQKIRCQR
jgi:hypothetical protein